MTGWPHFLHSIVAKGAKSPGMNVLDLQRPQATIFKDLPDVSASWFTSGFYHTLPVEQALSRLVSTGLQTVSAFKKYAAGGNFVLSKFSPAGNNSPY
jgi:hypothetical protein